MASTISLSWTFETYSMKHMQCWYQEFSFGGYSPGRSPPQGTLVLESP